MNKQRNQTDEFESESYRYVTSYLSDEIKTDFFFPNSLLKKTLTTMLDVGCGNGIFLNEWQKKFQLDRAVGIEPSAKAVNLLNDKWRSDDGIEFESAYAHDLPFENDSFDLVTTWSVLHWVGRNEYLQSIGELVRVCRKYLCIMDFVASKDYRVSYQHKEGMFTYKQDFDAVLKASGIMKPIETIRWWVNPLNGSMEFLKESDLEVFDKNTLSYHARKLVVYEKDYELLKVCSESDFK